MSKPSRQQLSFTLTQKWPEHFKKSSLKPLGLFLRSAGQVECCLLKYIWASRFTSHSVLSKCSSELPTLQHCWLQQSMWACVNFTDVRDYRETKEGLKMRCQDSWSHFWLDGLNWWSLVETKGRGPESMRSRTAVKWATAWTRNCRSSVPVFMQEFTRVGKLLLWSSAILSFSSKGVSPLEQGRSWELPS